ncbi:MAG: hypothetical protein NTZ17_12195 [Phycisphaerae bacterium]|nr:hypothetical protein [Phycisphaerae bacterium]
MSKERRSCEYQKIVICDDDEGLARLVQKDLLSEWRTGSPDIQLADSVEKLLRYVYVEKPQVIVLDHKFGTREDGKKAVAAMDRLPPGDRPAIIMFTAYESIVLKDPFIADLVPYVVEKGSRNLTDQIRSFMEQIKRAHPPQPVAKPIPLAWIDDARTLDRARFDQGNRPSEGTVSLDPNRRYWLVADISTESAESALSGTVKLNIAPPRTPNKKVTPFRVTVDSVAVETLNGNSFAIAFDWDSMCTVRRALFDLKAIKEGTVCVNFLGPVEPWQSLEFTVRLIEAGRDDMEQQGPEKWAAVNWVSAPEVAVPV